MCDFVLVLGRLAVNNQNLLPDHPQGCPAGIPASYNCFIAGEYKKHVIWKESLMST